MTNLANNNCSFVLPSEERDKLSLDDKLQLETFYQQLVDRSEMNPRRVETLRKQGRSWADIATEAVTEQNTASGKKPPLDIDILKDILRENGISVRYNKISHGVEINGVFEGHNPETFKNDLPTILWDFYRKRYVCTASSIADQINVIASQFCYNPVQELLNSSEPWDGTDRVEQIYNFLNIGESDELSRILIRKFLLQALSLAFNDELHPFGADGVLVLQGKQGIGKTSFVRKLGVLPELTKTGLYIDHRDKDTIRRCTSAWISELGELETSLRSDLERFKAFVTAEIDEYRLPYARSDSRFIRRTSIIATCNSDRFLIDPTGSRRFWVIPLEVIKLDELKDFNSLQLWKQIERELINNTQGFRLTSDEQAELAKRNASFDRLLKGQAELEDVFSEVEMNPARFEWADLTVSEFKSYFSQLHGFSAEQLGRALDKLEICAERKRINGKVCKVRHLPKRKYPYSGESV